MTGELLARHFPGLRDGPGKSDLGHAPGCLRPPSVHPLLGIPHSATTGQSLLRACFPTHEMGTALMPASQVCGDV